jgi:hypothetical protein
MFSRRDFLKKTGQAALAISGGLTLDALTKGCATVEFEEEAHVIYPPLIGHKVQPPKSGCYIGYHAVRVSYYEFRIEIRPKIIGAPWSAGYSNYFPRLAVGDIASRGSIPFVFRHPNWDIQKYGFKNLAGNKEFGESIKTYAKDVVDFGKPMFFSTMHEMNDSSKIRPWKGKSAKDVKKLWRHMWQIFEDNGANELATWVWSVNPSEIYYPGTMRNPEWFYPGDQYVDWIGLSVSSDARHPNASGPLSSLTGRTYTHMRTNHPEKPIMMSELSRTNTESQGEWLKDAYQTIKSWPGMKAVNLWDARNPVAGHDHQLSLEGMEALKEVFEDPYFIVAKRKWG